MIVDAHHHFWDYSPDEYGWIDPESMGGIARNFAPGDLRAVLDAAGVDAAVSVQARQTVDETKWLLSLADDAPWIAGVVGWAPLAAADARERLAELAHPKLCGVRHVVQDEPDDRFLLREDFNRGVAALLDFELVYDLLVFERHLGVAAEFVDRHPSQPFVLDHLAKPPINSGELQGWRRGLGELAQRPNVYAKLSGLVTEADWTRWRREDLLPCLDAALESFGPDRLMFGSDWPVCLLASGYEDWKRIIDDWAAPLSPSERSRLMGGVACEVYGLCPEGVC
ncbi:amidohydrolase family protein [Botrimarina sp.]|uniref:amidohydrolase family protein n=1 Tax=Botrimarina sp. TaxID=2795802 RepID=UPI0032EBE087